ncbi:uncharacterized protein LOC133179318 [Saccostrea echinata]|uniref:uncharacterized protein LOC133179318 n=1 Tax=Saccostrea echinata TaxID=191078 RepID=UPI002A80FA93|nr:uncharacterized protein LOC133179318 [Saccostrea echinata]
MERLVNICLLLALISVQFVFSESTLKVYVTPEKTTFYSEFGENPTENIICKSNCSGSNCIYQWYIYNASRNREKFTDGNILFLKRVTKRNSTFKCYVYVKGNQTRFYGYSKEIEVIVKRNRSSASPTYSVSKIQSTTNMVYSHSTTAGKYDESFLFIVIGISGGTAFLITTIILVGILCMRGNKRRKNSIRNDTTPEKDHGLELTENTLYITADNVIEMPPSVPAHNDTPTSENDVYAVVNKEKITENHIPVYAEVCTSQEGKDKQATEKKPSEKETNKLGQATNKEGMVYVEIDFKDMPSNGKSALHGAENKTLYVDINSVKHADSFQKSGQEDSHDFHQNGEE